jgi:undecaprenyl-diphosphatase
VAHCSATDMRLTADHKTGMTLLVGFTLAVGVLVLFSWLAEEVFEGDTRRFDEQVRAVVNQHASPTLTAAMRVVTYFGSTILISALGVCAVLAFYLLKWHRAALLLVITMAGAFLLNAVLKLSFHRARPVPFFGLVAPHSYSFPSGHALFSFCLFGLLAIVINRRVPSAAVRGGVWATAALLVVLVGCSRIYLGVHYPSDVLAGYAAAFVWLLAVALGDRLFHQHEHETTN